MLSRKGGCDGLANKDDKKIAQEFLYEGKPIYLLDPITDIKAVKKQREEMKNRFIAMREFALENRIMLTPKHLQNVLGVSKDTWNRWQRGVSQLSGLGSRQVVPIEQSNHGIETVLHIKKVQDLINKWLDYCEQWALDHLCHDTVATRSMFTLNNVFGYKNLNADSGSGTAEKLVDMTKTRSARKKAQ